MSSIALTEITGVERAGGDAAGPDRAPVRTFPLQIVCGPRTTHQLRYLVESDRDLWFRTLRRACLEEEGESVRERDP